MSHFNRALRPPPTWSDEAIERYLAAVWGQVEPDPLFRRRLRSEVVNRYVAVREGIISPTRSNVGGRLMGRLGRATLYASFALVATGASVLAASQEALPGDPLYGLKLRIEQLRVEVLPTHLHDELAANGLWERTDEMSRLAAAGQLEAALDLAPVIERAYIALETLAAAGDPATAERIVQHLVAVARVVDGLPSPARAAVVAATGARPDAAGDQIRPRGPNNGSDNNTGTNPNGSTNAGGDNNTGFGGARHGRGTAGPSPEASPEATGSPQPTATPKPTAEPRATATPKPTATPRPSPTSDPESSEDSQGGVKGKSSNGGRSSDEDSD